MNILALFKSLCNIPLVCKCYKAVNISAATFQIDI